MRQLGVTDAAFINIENPTVPQQIGSLGIYDPSTAPGGFVRFKDVLRSFQRRLQQNPSQWCCCTPSTQVCWRVGLGGCGVFGLVCCSSQRQHPPSGNAAGGR